MPIIIVDLKPFFGYIHNEMKTQYLLGGVGLLAVILISWWYIGMSAPAPVEQISTLVRIGEGTTHALTMMRGTTSLTATRQIAEVTTEGEGPLALVTTIDGVAADADAGESWRLVVNGVAPSVSAVSYVIQDGDKLHWVIAKGSALVVE